MARIEHDLTKPTLWGIWVRNNGSPEESGFLQNNGSAVEFYSYETASHEWEAIEDEPQFKGCTLSVKRISDAATT